MLISKMTCPSCKRVLRPSKPLPEGKKVKCPQCGTDFTALPDANSPGSRRPAQAKSAPAPVIEVVDDEEELEEETYGVVHDPEDAEAAAEPRKVQKTARPDSQKKPKIDYVPDLSIKDPRGAAQVAVIRPSNWLMITGILGALGWILVITALLWPYIFPDKPREQRADEIAAGPQQGGARRTQVFEIGPGVGAVYREPQELVLKKLDERQLPPREPSTNLLEEIGISELSFFEWYWLALILIGLALGAFYGALIAYGAVKMQNLESRQWGLASSIMAMIPINAGGFGLVICSVVHLLLVWLADEEWQRNVALLAVAALTCLWGISIGIRSLFVLMDEKVREGYEYVPD